MGGREGFVELGLGGGLGVVWGLDCARSSALLEKE